MKARKKGTLYALIVLFLTYVLLTWIFPSMAYSSEFAEQGSARMGISDVTNTLIGILDTYPNHSANDLLKPLDRTDDVSEGIYKAMEKAGSDGYVYVTVSWENQVQQDYEQFEQSIRAEIRKIKL